MVEHVWILSSLDGTNEQTWIPTSPPATIPTSHPAMSPTLLRSAVAFLVAPLVCQGAMITSADILPIPAHTVGSGNGTIDLRMMTFSGSEITNASGMTFNGDNGNATIPNGGGADTNFFVESYYTTAGDLRAFYDLNFGPNVINEIVVFLDLNETGGAKPNNRLLKLDLISNPTTVQGNPDPTGDLTGAQQAAINQVFTGGTVLASLSTTPLNLPVVEQGAGFADYAIFTGVNPYSLDPSTRLLFNISMDTLNNGAEELFLSGEYSAEDIAATSVPEPSALLLCALGGLGFICPARRRRESGTPTEA